MRSRLRSFLLASAGMAAAMPAYGIEQYQAPDAFVAESFSGSAPEPSVLWITGDLRKQATAILEHDPEGLRLRYWRKGKRTAWVLEEIGKERAITTGWAVEDDVVQQARVLIYRESRGWEIHQRFFTDQFLHAGLDDKSQLNRHIDGVTGATLSVNAMRRMARLALLYHRYVMTNVAIGH